MAVAGITPATASFVRRVTNNLDFGKGRGNEMDVDGAVGDNESVHSNHMSVLKVVCRVETTIRYADNSVDHSPPRPSIIQSR